jgi:hypothetical protein
MLQAMPRWGTVHEKILQKTDSDSSDQRQMPYGTTHKAFPFYVIVTMTHNDNIKFIHNSSNNDSRDHKEIK